MTSPNFIIGGVTKAGTTSLHYYLSQHPDIYMSSIKEPWYFVTHYHRSIDFYEQTYFHEAKNEKAIGEATPGYLDIASVRKKIKKHYPEMKFIFILRDPIERAYSHWQMNTRRGTETYSFYDAIKEGVSLLPNTKDEFYTENRFRAWRDPKCKNKVLPRERYIDSGFYAIHIKEYLELFDKSQIKILLFDDLKNDPAALLTECLKFLEIDTSVEGIDFTIKNSNRLPITKTIARLIGIKNAEKLSCMIPKPLKEFIRKISSRFVRLKKKETMTELERELLYEIYYEHNNELSRLLNRDLSHWNRK